MEVRITGRHGALGADVKRYVHDKLGPVSRYWDRTSSLEVVFDEAELGWKVEVIAHVQRAAPLIASISHKDPRAAVDLAHDKIERLLTRAKEKSRGKRRREGHAAQPAAGATPPEEE